LIYVKIPATNISRLGPFKETAEIEQDWQKIQLGPGK
jgi:hypothetical protein